MFRLERKIPLRRIVAKTVADEIDQMVQSNTETEKGDLDYPGEFQKALSTYMKGLSDEEKAEFEKIREEWQAKGPPLDIQLK